MTDENVEDMALKIVEIVKKSNEHIVKCYDFLKQSGEALKKARTEAIESRSLVSEALKKLEQIRKHIEEA